MRNALFMHIHVIGARLPGLRLIVQVVIIPAEIDIAPALDRPVKLIFDAGSRRIVENRPVIALMQPLYGLGLAREAADPKTKMANFASSKSVTSFRARDTVSHA